jgi:hypothetical protein
MSKKTKHLRKKPGGVPREVNVHPESFQLRSPAKPSASAKAELTQHELRGRYGYVITDLKAIGIIAIPMIVLMIIGYIVTQ